MIDPRHAVVRDIIDRIERPRTYAGDWPGDTADRILRAIDAVTDSGNNHPRDKEQT